MKRLLVVTFFVFACACGLHAQATDVNICDVLKNPKSFDGKIVRIKGTVVAGFDEFIVKDSAPCGYQVDGIWISYPQGTKGKAGPVAMVQVQPAHNFSGTYAPPTRAAVTLDKSKDFKQFDSLLSQSHSSGSALCPGCTRYHVNATLIGRLDTVADASLQRDKDGKIIGFGGFGNMNAYPARLVLQSVSDVTSKEVDFSKANDAAKGGPAVPLGAEPTMFDPVDVAQKLATVLAGNPTGDQAAKDAALFTKANSKNGVSLISGQINEVAATDAPGVKDSPDGVLFNCYWNTNHLDSGAQPGALIHLGHHVNDLRTPVAGNESAPLFIFEYNGWSMTAASAMAASQKLLILPGGYVFFNAATPADGRTEAMDASLQKFLADEAALSR